MPISHHTGTDIYSLAISKTNALYEKIDLLHEHDEVEDIDIDMDMDTEVCYALNENDIQVASYTVPTLPVFSVYYNGTITEYGAMNYYYLYYVVASELLKPNSNVYDGLTDAEKLEGFKAQAIAARTYVTTKTVEGTRHVVEGYDICSNSECCQVYNPTYTNTMSVQAVNDTHNRIVYDVAKNRLCTTFFFASCTGKTKYSYEVWSNVRASYLVPVSCDYDLRPSKKLGHGVGMCQDGAMGMAGQGMTCDEILMHYYTGTEVITANPNPN